MLKKHGIKALFSEFQSATVFITLPNYIKMDTWSFKNYTMCTDLHSKLLERSPTNTYLQLSNNS